MSEERPTIASVNSILLRLEKRLFGNGQPGVIQELVAADEANRLDVATKHKANQDAIAEFKKYKWIGVGIILATGGSGVVSVATLLKVLGH